MRQRKLPDKPRRDSKNRFKNEIDIKLINPGFGKHEAHRQKLVPNARSDDSKEAIIISDGLNSKKFEIHFPKKLSFILKFLSILPYFTSSICLKMLKLK